MARRCIITGKGVMSGNNVSHANNRTRRRFLPNLQDVSFFSDILGEKIKLRVSARGVRTIEHKGGFDSFVSNTAKTKLHADLHDYKKRVEAATAKAADA